MTSNVVTKALTFPDQSTFRGQVLQGRTLAPHGYGVLTSNDGFEMAGFFLNGKACGPGCFTSPNGERFYGQWNALHNRDGPFLAVRPNASESSPVPRLLVEHYAGGELLKRLKPAAARPGVIAWALEPPVEYSSPADCDGAGVGEAEAPCPRTGHSAAVLGLPNSGIISPMTAAIRGQINPLQASSCAGRSVALFGGSTCTESGAVLEMNDLWLLDVPTVTWRRAPRSGAAPPGLRASTLTVVPAAGGGELLVLLGGQSGISSNVSVFVYDTRTGVWGLAPWQAPAGLTGHTATALPDERLPPAPGADAGATTAAAVDRAHIAAAGAGAGIVVICAGRAWALHTRTWQWSELPQSWPTRQRVHKAFTHHAAAAGADGRVWVHGGQPLSVGAGWGSGAAEEEGKEYVRCTSVMRAYDPLTGVWEVKPAPPARTRKGNLPPLPSSSSPAPTTATTATTAAVAAAASAKSAAAGSKAAYSGLELGWNGLPRSQHSLTADEDGSRLYVIGGWTTAHPQMNVIDTNYLADVHVYDLESDQWETPTLRFPICPPRAGHAAVPARAGEVWVLGGCNDGSPEAGLWDLCVLTTGKCAAETVGVAAAGKAGGAGSGAVRTGAGTVAKSAAVAQQSKAPTSSTARAGAGAGQDRAALLLAAAERRRVAAAAAAAAATPQADEDGGDDDDDCPLEVGSGNILAAFTKNIR